MSRSQTNFLKTFNDKEFINLETAYDQLLGELGLNLGRSRFKKSFRDYAKVTEALSDSDSQMVPDNLIMEFRYATYDLSQLLDIYSTVKDYSNKQILKDKLKKLNEGSSNPAEETNKNTVARDTQFELKLYSDFKQSGINSALDDPRPDIRIKGQKQGYAIECKRIFSDDDSKVSKRIGEARDQLKTHLKDNKSDMGIIAIDITRRLTGGNKYLRAKDERMAIARLNHEIDLFRRRFARFWSAKRIGEPRIVAILFYASMYAYLEDRELASSASQVVIQNIHNNIFSNILINDAVNEVFVPLSIYRSGT